MARVMTSAMLSAIQSGILRPAYFVSMTFRSGVANIWTGFGPITWNSITWQGQGKLLSISAIEEGSTVAARGISIGLSGIPTDMLTDAISDFKIAAPVLVYFGLFDAAGALIADPVQAWGGRMDKPKVRWTGPTATIDIACETKFIEMNTAVDRRRTHDDQQLDHPGDLVFSFVAGLQEKPINWGNSSLPTNNI